MDIAVVDDEKAIREHICGLVEEQQPESRIEAYATGGELQEYLSELNRGLEKLEVRFRTGNTVDNAIEACRKLKAKEPGADGFIRISSLQKGNLLILKVENSFDGRLVLKAKEEFPVTDKVDRKSHGIGLVNIKSTAEKYQGAVDFRVKGRVFILSVMMKNERREEEGVRNDR